MMGEIEAYFTHLRNNIIHKNKSLPNDSEKNRGHLKTLWTKEKMLVTSIISFPHSGFNLFKDTFHHTYSGI